MQRRLLVVLLVLVSSQFVVAQNPTLDRLVDHFVLDNVSSSAADLSPDGKWLVVTTASLRDRIGINNYRFGDPTYTAPSVTDVSIIDTATGKSQRLLPAKQQVRGFKWSPDSSRLAFFRLKGETFEPVLWERATSKLDVLALPPEKESAENAEIEWSANGNEILFAVRTKTWREDARKRFEHETKATVVVHSSTEPFLTWEDVRRMGAVRSVVGYNIRTAAWRDVITEKRISSYSLLEDGSTVTYAEDITKKTDYDTIMGVENQILAMPAEGGTTRTLIKSSKGLSIIWSRDEQRYAYSKDGKVWIGSIDGSEPRQIAGKVDDAKDAKKETDPKDNKDDEKFTAVRLSVHGDRLVASDKKGLWLIDTATGTKDLVIPMAEEDKEAPRYQVVDFSPDGGRLYVSYGSRKIWERGIERYEVATKA